MTSSHGHSIKLRISIVNDHQNIASLKANNCYALKLSIKILQFVAKNFLEMRGTPR
jgi:hypothetical protein